MPEDLRAAQRSELVPHHRSRIAGNDVRDGAFPIQLDGALRGADAAVRQLPAVAARPIFVAVEIDHRSPSQISAHASSVPTTTAKMHSAMPYVKIRHAIGSDCIR